jgi:putative sterol carrier protein
VATTTADAFFEQLAQRGHEPLVEKALGLLQIDLRDGDETTSWFLSFDRGDLAVSREGAEADCTLRMEGSVFDRVMKGDTNAMSALLRGEVEVHGDTDLLVLFQRLLPGRRDVAGPADVHSERRG